MSFFTFVVRYAGGGAGECMKWVYSQDGSTHKAFVTQLLVFIITPSQPVWLSQGSTHFKAYSKSKIKIGLLNIRHLCGSNKSFE